MTLCNALRLPVSMRRILACAGFRVSRWESRGIFPSFLVPGMAPGATHRQSIVIPNSCQTLLSGRTVAAPTEVGQ
jgi:hypothetical protein